MHRSVSLIDFLQCLGSPFACKQAKGGIRHWYAVSLVHPDVSLTACVGADYDMTECSPGELDPHAVASIFKAFLRERKCRILFLTNGAYLLAQFLNLSSRMRYCLTSRPPYIKKAQVTHNQPHLLRLERVLAVEAMAFRQVLGTVYTPSESLPLCPPLPCRASVGCDLRLGP